MSDKGMALVVIGALVLGAVGFYYFYMRPGGEVAPPTTAPPTTQAPSTTAPPTKKPKPPRSPRPTPPPTTSGPSTSPPPSEPSQIDYASLWGSLPPGTWARYEITLPQGEVYMTVTVEGREVRGGAECLRVTYEYEGAGGQQTASPSVTAWINVATGETVEVQICIPGVGCRAASPQQYSQYEYVPPQTSSVVGVETVTVPAGTFSCYKIVYQGATVWWSPDAPPLGVVKAVYPQGEMILVALGP
ncbi:MAG: hypothetical protein QI223_08855 [Candidatus Korarchaeota archaeon]|nr:hypothetical protein [Candidatus Korarchaeota archaeon]